MSAQIGKIKNLLSRGVESVVDKKHLEAALVAGKPLRVKLGIDPTSPELHLGHSIVLRKLREFQDLGSVAVLIIGDFTAQIGDPSGRDKTRPPLTEAEVKGNMQNYLRQAGKIIDIKKTELAHNSTWLGKLNGKKLIELLGRVSVQQIIGREDFKNRLALHKPIRIHELLYPVMQAYDSVAVRADVELGGTDQTFNLLVGRDLMEKLGMQPQDIMTLQILEGTDGKQKMSKSLGNYIGLSDDPDDMFGKIMSVPDGLMCKYFILTTDVPRETIEGYTKDLQGGRVNPKTIKEKLAFEIVKRYHGGKAAEKAGEKWEKVFSRKEFSVELPELETPRSIYLLELVLLSGVTEGKRNRARSLIAQGAVSIDGEVRRHPHKLVTLKRGEVLKVGKRHFFRIKIR